MLDILELLGSLVYMVINFIKSIIWFVTNLPSMMAILYEAVYTAPFFILPFLLLSLAGTALFAIIRLL